MKVRNKTLYKKVRSFVTASNELLKKISMQEPFPVSLESLYEGEARIDFFLFIFKHFDELEKLPEFLDCAKYILNNPTTQKATGWMDKEGFSTKNLPIKLTYFRILYLLLGQHLKQVGKLSFTRDYFDQIYLEFEKYVYTSKVLYKVTAFLRGLSGSIEEVNFGNGFKARRISDSEKNMYEKKLLQPFSRPFKDLDIISTDYILETTYSHRKGSPVNTSLYKKKFEDIVTVLRLYKAGRVGFDFIRTESITWDPMGGSMYSGGSHRQGNIFPASYKLDVSEKPELLRLWQRFKNFNKTVGSSKSGRYINLALKRFNFGVEESNHENKIIDFFVAFEALCLPEKDELAYRLSNRIAMLLGSNVEEAGKIKKFMVKAYKVRSKIVHGAEIKSITIDGEEIKLGDFAKRVEQYLRGTLKSFIVLSKKYKKQKSITDLLDKSLIDIETRKVFPK